MQQRLHRAGSETTFAADRPTARSDSPQSIPVQHAAATQTRLQALTSAWHPRTWDPRKLLVCYFIFIFGSRLYLRSECSDGLHWGFVMIMEDGMSVMSFALGLLYLNKSNGAAMAMLTKCVNRHNQAEAEATDPTASMPGRGEPQPTSVADPAPGADTTTTGTPEQQKAVRLFYFAM